MSRGAAFVAGVALGMLAGAYAAQNYEVGRPTQSCTYDCPHVRTCVGGYGTGGQVPNVKQEWLKVTEQLAGIEKRFRKQ
jgi:hypothetical protein